MQDLHKRLAKLEVASTPPGPPRHVRRFMIEAPTGTNGAEAVAFFRASGHEVRDTDLNIIRRVVGAENGRPFGLPLKDRTSASAA